MYFTNYDMNLTAYDNVVNEIIINNGYQARKSKKLKEVLENQKASDGTIEKISIISWFRSIYGAERPTCLGDKIIREFKRIYDQAEDELKRFYDKVEDEISNFASKAKDELKNAYDKVEDTIKGIGDSIKSGFKKVFGGW